tara:strand:- start:217 stop:492 length:276 start_codon:yes stop_codon:yes gene_type:complete
MARLMKIEDSAPHFPPSGVRYDPFDLLDSTGELLVHSMRLAIRQRARDEDIPALLRELADMLDAHVDGSGQDIMLYYLAARLRERADKPLD